MVDSSSSLLICLVCLGIWSLFVFTQIVKFFVLVL